MMPTYRITDPQTGKVLRVTGDSPPSEQELEEIFATQSSQPSGLVAAGQEAGDLSGLPGFEEQAQATAAAPERSLGADLARGAGLTARGVLQGTSGSLAGVLDAAAYPVNAAYRGITGNQNDLIGSYRQAVNEGMDIIGLPTPQSGTERVLGSLTAGATSAPLGMGVGGLLARSANPVTAGVGNLLQAAPGSQVAAGAGSGGASQLAAEAGVGPAGQQIAGLVGGIGSGIAARNIDAPVTAGTLPIGAATSAPEAAAIRGEQPFNTTLNRIADSADAAVAPATREYQQAVDTLKRSGVNLTKGQESGTNWLKQTERTLSDVPFSGKPLQRRFEGQQQQYQKALLQKAGNTRGDAMITRQTLENTADDLSRAYTEALEGKRVSISSDEFLDDLATVEAKHSSFVDDPTKSRVRRVVTEFLEKADAGDVDGKWYQAQRSLFAKRAKGTGELADLYGDLKGVLDDAFRRSAGDVKGELDSKYARYSQLRNIWERSGGPAASEGFISPVAVAREAAGAPGGKSWQDFTRAGAAVLPDRLGNSGTAQRNFTLGLVGGTVPAALIEPTSLTAMLAGAAGGRGLSSVLASGSRQPLLGQPQPSTIAPLIYPAVQGAQ